MVTWLLGDSDGDTLGDKGALLGGDGTREVDSVGEAIRWVFPITDFPGRFKFHLPPNLKPLPLK